MVNNCLHWIVRSYVDDDYNNNDDDDNVGGSYYNDFWDLRFVNRIVYFDSPTNEFKTVPVPDSIEIGGEEKIIVGIGVLDEYLCMMRPISSGGITYTEKCDIELLVMKAYGVKASWTRLYYIKDMWPTYIHYEFLKLVMVKDDSLIFQISNQIWAYYPKNSRMEMIKIKGLNENKNMLKGVVSYVETLISPVGYDWNDEEHKEIGSVSTLIYEYNVESDDEEWVESDDEEWY
ncbi:hypothetical protein LIER_18785 [Lithospermum erythrorhizon]|uniref:Uncharacterized protein n=1 Tax=Lithospermum erythrorhizon TaxID=34254 RepID=A0AAV3QHU8_LITER